MKNKLNQSQINKGFTLVEMLVAVAIFTIVMLIAITSLLSINEANKKTAAIRTVSDGLSFALENMTRTMRLGNDYKCASTGTDCSALRFLAYDPVTEKNTRQVVYGYGLTTSSQIERCNPDNIPASCVAITPSEVKINVMRFDIGGIGSDSYQPRVLVFIQGEILIKGEKTDFSVQTLVSQRGIEQL